MTRANRFPPLAPQEPDVAPRGLGRALLIGAALAAAAILGALAAQAGPTDYAACGRYDAFRAAIQAEGYTRWPGYLYATVDGQPKRAEVWYQPAREEWRMAVVDQVNGRITSASKTCVTLYSDPASDLWRVE